MTHQGASTKCVCVKTEQGRAADQTGKGQGLNVMSARDWIESRATGFILVLMRRFQTLFECFTGFLVILL